jgi:hypothetical protein
MKKIFITLMLVLLFVKIGYAKELDLLTPECLKGDMGIVRSTLCTTVGIPLDAIGIAIPVTGFTLMATGAVAGAIIAAPITVPMMIADKKKKSSEKTQYYDTPQYYQNQQYRNVPQYYNNYRPY